MVLRPVRIFDDNGCVAIPAVAEPGRFLVHFPEGNDRDDDLITLTERVDLSNPDLKSEIDRFLRDDYAAKNTRRCRGFLGDFACRTSRPLRCGRKDLEAAMRPLPLSNQLIIAGAPRRARSAAGGEQRKCGERFTHDDTGMSVRVYAIAT